MLSEIAGPTRLFGKYSGEVVAVADDDRLGKLDVTVPTVFGAGVVVRARPCFPPGHFFVPPPGEKVWVEFEQGDPDYPIWVGVWYPTGTVPAAADVSPPHARVIHTPSGHTLELHDEEGRERIQVRHRSGAVLSIDEKGVVALSNPGGSSLLLEGDTIRLVADRLVLQGSDIQLGEDASEPILLGRAFWTLFQSHVHATAMGPSGPPMPPVPAPPAPPPSHVVSAAVRVR